MSDVPSEAFGALISAERWAYLNRKITCTLGGVERDFPAALGRASPDNPIDDPTGAFWKYTASSHASNTLALR